MVGKNLRTALLISGSGTTAEAVIMACQSSELAGIEIVAVIASKSDAGGIEKAQNLGIPTHVVRVDDLLVLLKKLRVQLVSQNGWLPLTPKEVVDEYEGMIVNQHPGPLDPGYADFGGKGMYGARVVAARLIYSQLVGGDFWTEATTHLVTEEFDRGLLLRTERLEFSPGARTEDIQQQLLLLEHKNVIETLKLFARGKAVGHGRKERLVEEKNLSFLDEAKRMAVKLFP